VIKNGSWSGGPLGGPPMVQPAQWLIRHWLSSVATPLFTLRARRMQNLRWLIDVSTVGTFDLYSVDANHIRCSIVTCCVSDGGVSAAKKCRARYGLEHQNRWCKPCRSVLSFVHVCLSLLFTCLLSSLINVTCIHLKLNWLPVQHVHSGTCCQLLCVLASVDDTFV